jgi:hypothetical protein
MEEEWPVRRRAPYKQQEMLWQEEEDGLLLPQL